MTKERLDRLDQEVCQETQDPEVHLEYREILAQEVHSVHREIAVHEEVQVVLVTRENVEVPDQADQLVPLDQEVVSVCLETLEVEDLEDLMDQLELPEILEHVVAQDLLAVEVLPGPLENLVCHSKQFDIVHK